MRIAIKSNRYYLFNDCGQWSTLRKYHEHAYGVAFVNALKFLFNDGTYEYILQMSMMINFLAETYLPTYSYSYSTYSHLLVHLTGNTID